MNLPRDASWRPISRFLVDDPRDRPLADLLLRFVEGGAFDDLRDCGDALEPARTTRAMELLEGYLDGAEVKYVFAVGWKVSR